MAPAAAYVIVVNANHAEQGKLLTPVRATCCSCHGLQDVVVGPAVLRVAESGHQEHLREAGRLQLLQASRVGVHDVAQNLPLDPPGGENGQGWRRVLGVRHP